MVRFKVDARKGAGHPHGYPISRSQTFYTFLIHLPEGEAHPHLRGEDSIPYRLYGGLSNYTNMTVEKTRIPFNKTAPSANYPTVAFPKK